MTNFRDELHKIFRKIAKTTFCAKQSDSKNIAETRDELKRKKGRNQRGEKSPKNLMPVACDNTAISLHHLSTNIPLAAKFSMLANTKQFKIGTKHCVH